jgi:phospholipase A-2-activating protein
VQLTQGKGARLSDSTVSILGKLALWPAAQLFPVLDIMRLLVLNPANAKLLSYDAGSLDAENAGLGGMLARGLSPEATAATVLVATRLACNCFLQPPLRKWLLPHTSSMLDLLTEVDLGASKHSRIAWATLLLNYGVALFLGEAADHSCDGRARVLSMLYEVCIARDISPSVIDPTLLHDLATRNT